jgi:hypothetical protein
MTNAASGEGYGCVQEHLFVSSQSIEGAPDRWADQGSVGIISIGYGRFLASAQIRHLWRTIQI